MEQQPVGYQSLGNQAFGLASIAAENARFMSRVYCWMTSGLCLAGAVAWNVAGNPQLVQTIFGNRLLFWGLIIAQLGAVSRYRASSTGSTV
jgi:FtsH-binding integral membrane protein